MFGLDEHLAELGGGGLALTLLVAVLLGLRHATDPDHLTAVSTLVASDRAHGARRAWRLGLAWGAGHGVTLVALGLVAVLFRRFLPPTAQTVAEVAIGAIIVALGVRVLIRWRRGYFHSHPHRHGGLEHAHPHVHEHAPRDPHPDAHRHPHPETLGRSPAAAFGIGLVHGVGGSAGAGILIVTAASGQAGAVVALLVFAAGTALAMGGVSAALGLALGRGLRGRTLERAMPALGVAGALFGLWYALGALETVPYAF